VLVARAADDPVRPRRLIVPAQRRPDPLAAGPGTVRYAAARATLWATRVVRGWLNALDRALGGEAPPSRAAITDVELRALVAANPTLDADERRIIDEVLTAGARHVSAVMVPRNRVVYLDADLSVADAFRAVRETPHSRFPVIDGSHDDIVGFVHLRDLLMPAVEGDVNATGLTVGALARDVRRLPTSKHVLAALSEMRREGHHLAVVVDEYGGTAGIVTLEDLIEELVGEIHDEYDAAPEPESVPGDVDGRLHLADFAQLCGFELPPGPYETLGGFLMARLGRLPAIGDEVRVDQWRLVVTECEGRRVSRVAVRAVP
jgi:putative hemolysin